LRKVLKEAMEGRGSMVFVPLPVLKTNCIIIHGFKLQTNLLHRINERLMVYIFPKSIQECMNDLDLNLCSANLLYLHYTHFTFLKKRNFLSNKKINAFILKNRCQGYLIYGKLSLDIFLSVLLMISYFNFSNPFLQNEIQLAYSQRQTSVTNNSNYSSNNEISNALLEQFKEIVYTQSSNKSSNNAATSNSNIPIVVGIITTNGTQVSGIGNISSSNNTRINGDTVFDIASIAKTFVATILSDMVKQGIVSLDDPVEKYLPSNVTVPSYNGHKITLEDLAPHTSGA
jgi:beta-lactamase family protein